MPVPVTAAGVAVKVRPPDSFGTAIDSQRAFARACHKRHDHNTQRRRRMCRRSASPARVPHRSRAAARHRQAQSDRERVLSPRRSRSHARSDDLHRTVAAQAGGAQRPRAALSRTARRARVRQLCRAGLRARDAHGFRAGEHSRRRVLPGAGRVPGFASRAAELPQRELHARRARSDGARRQRVRASGRQADGRRKTATELRLESGRRRGPAGRGRRGSRGAGATS